jgi:hypothetical protein
MLEFIQHLLGLCPDHHSHLNVLSILGEQSYINQIIQLIKFKFK